MSYINTRDFRIAHDIYESENSEWFEVDELIAPAIRELNLKGYTTKFCCSGHPHDSEASSWACSAYIVFMDGIINDNMRFPDNWYVDDNSTTIRHDYCIADEDSPSRMGYQKLIMSEMEKLYMWTKELPNIKDQKLKEYHIICKIPYGQCCYAAYADSYDAAFKEVLDYIAFECYPDIIDVFDIDEYEVVDHEGDLDARTDITPHVIYDYGPYREYTNGEIKFAVTQVENTDKPIAYCIGTYVE